MLVPICNLSAIRERVIVVSRCKRKAILTFCGSPLSRQPRSCSFHPSLPNSCSVMRSALAASHGQMTQKPLDRGLAALQLVRRLLFGAWHFSVPIVPTRNFERPFFAFSQTHVLG